MNKETIRQGTIEFLKRAPENTFIGASYIEDSILGRDYEKGDYYGTLYGEKEPGPRTKILRELVDMCSEGIIEYSAHRGYRLPKEKND